MSTLNDHASSLRVPVHSRIADKLRQDILAGRFDATGRLPSETSLAELFGVSRTTISRVMLDLRSQGVILTHPGTPAKLSRFSQNASGVIGIVDPGMSCGDVLASICSRAARLAEKIGWKVLRRTLTATTPSARMSEAMSIAGEFAESHVSGVLMQPLEFQQDNEKSNNRLFGRYEARNMGVVLLDYDIVPSPKRSKYDLVALDNVAAGQRVATRVFEKGARRLVFLLPPGAPYSMIERLHGVAIAAFDAGVPWSSSKNVLVVRSDERTKVRAFLREAKVDAVICGNDVQAMAVRSLLRDPDRILFGGFDGIPQAKAAGIISVRQPCDDLARVAVRTLVSRIGSPRLPTRTIRLMPQDV